MYPLTNPLMPPIHPFIHPIYPFAGMHDFAIMHRVGVEGERQGLFLYTPCIPPMYPPPCTAWGWRGSGRVWASPFPFRIFRRFVPDDPTGSL